LIEGIWPKTGNARTKLNRCYLLKSGQISINYLAIYCTAFLPSPLPSFLPLHKGCRINKLSERVFRHLSNAITFDEKNNFQMRKCKNNSYPILRRDLDHLLEGTLKRALKLCNVTTTRGAIHQLLNIILQLRILVLLLVSTLPSVVKVKN
jgi:hypothetical protein